MGSAVSGWTRKPSLAAKLEAGGAHPPEALRRAADELVSEQIAHVSLPRRFATPMIEVYQMQPRFTQREGKRPLRLLAHPRFRAAYDFLVLRSEAGEVDAELAEWWTRMQAASTEEQRSLAAPSGAAPAGRRRRSRHRRRRPAASQPA